MEDFGLETENPKQKYFPYLNFSQKLVAKTLRKAKLKRSQLKQIYPLIADNARIRRGDLPSKFEHFEKIGESKFKV